jgi:hypothetical protein
MGADSVYDYSADCCDYTPDAAVIQQKKMEMLLLDDNKFNFAFSYENEVLDPHAHWLMNRMMQMVQLVKTPTDDWAWMLAMNESIEEYNRRLGRKTGSVEIASMAIEELANNLGAGSQIEINMASYVMMILTHYKTVYHYYELIDDIDNYDEHDDSDEKLRALYYKEFEEWFNINNAANGLMYFYTYSIAHYSALPMDINGTFEVWSKNRSEELAIERDIYMNRYSQTGVFKSDAQEIPEKAFTIMLEYFKSRTQENMIEEFLEEWGGFEYEYAKEKIEENMDFDKIKEMVHYYETALANWRKIRSKIELTYPYELMESYNEITKQIHTRLYMELVDLIKIRY